MVEIEQITEDQAVTLLRDRGEGILKMDGGYAELEDVILLLGTSDRINKYSGVGYGLEVRVNTTWHKIDLT